MVIETRDLENLCLGQAEPFRQRAQMPGMQGAEPVLHGMKHFDQQITPLRKSRQKGLDIRRAPSSSGRPLACQARPVLSNIFAIDRGTP